jgi:hypothetical protein
MAKIDGSYYLTLTDLLNKYADFENVVSKSVDESMLILRDNIQMISRPEEVKYFLDDFKQTFNDNPHLNFETVGIDDCKEVFVDDVTKIALGQKLGQMLVIDAALIQQQEAKEKELKGAQQLLDLYNTSEKHEKTASPLTPMDVIHTLTIVGIRSLQCFGPDQMSTSEIRYPNGHSSSPKRCPNHARKHRHSRRKTTSHRQIHPQRRN